MCGIERVCVKKCVCLLLLRSHLYHADGWRECGPLFWSVWGPWKTFSETPSLALFPRFIHHTPFRYPPVTLAPLSSGHTSSYGAWRLPARARPPRLPGVMPCGLLLAVSLDRQLPRIQMLLLPFLSSTFSFTPTLYYLSFDSIPPPTTVCYSHTILYFFHYRSNTS